MKREDKESLSGPWLAKQQFTFGNSLDHLSYTLSKTGEWGNAMRGEGIDQLKIQFAPSSLSNCQSSMQNIIMYLLKIQVAKST